MTNLYAPELGVINLKNTYQLNTVVETGCYQGHGLEFARSIGIQSLYSCDINQTYVNNCRNKFPGADIRHLDSVSFLKEVLPTINEKTLFWLDAHYPIHYGLDHEDHITKFPLVEELKLLKSLKKNLEQDVIICDDLRVLLPDENPYYNPSVGQQFLVDYTIRNLTEVLEDTHNHYLVSVDTGNLIFIPR